MDHLVGLRIFSVLLGGWIEAIKRHKFLICLFSNKKFYFFPAIIDKCNSDKQHKDGLKMRQ